MTNINLPYECKKYGAKLFKPPLCGSYEYCKGCEDDPNYVEKPRAPLGVIRKLVEKQLPEKYWPTATPDIRSVNRYLDSGSYPGAKRINGDGEWDLEERPMTLVIRPWDIGPTYVNGKQTTDGDFEKEMGMTRRHARRLGYVFDYWNNKAWTFTSSCQAFKRLLSKRKGA